MFLDSDLKFKGKLDDNIISKQIDIINSILWMDKKYDRQSWETPLLVGRQFSLPFKYGPIREYSDCEQIFVDSFMMISEKIKNDFYPNSVIMRGEMAGIPPKSKLLFHMDNKWFHKYAARIHVPFKTNINCFNLFEDRKYHLEVGDIWEINNIIKHSAINEGDDIRLHLILDIIDIKTLEYGKNNELLFVRCGDAL